MEDDEKIRGIESKMAEKRIRRKTSSDSAPSRPKEREAKNSFGYKTNSSVTLNCICDDSKFCHRSKRSSKCSFSSLDGSTKSHEKSKTTKNVFCEIIPSDHNLIFNLSNTSIEDLLTSHCLTSFKTDFEAFETPLEKFSRRLRAREEEQVLQLFPENIGDTNPQIFLKTDEFEEGASLDSADLKTETTRQAINNSVSGKNKALDELVQRDYFGNQNSTEVDNDDQTSNRTTSSNPSRDKDFAKTLNELHTLRSDLVKAGNKNRKLQEQLRRSVKVEKVPDYLKLENESNNSQITLSNRNENPEESTLNTEDVHTIKKLLELIASGGGFNQEKTVTARDSSSFEGKRKPRKLSRVFTYLLSKIKGRPKSQNDGPESIGDAHFGDQFKTSRNSTQKVGKFKKKQENQSKCSKSVDEERYHKPYLTQNLIPSDFPCNTHQELKSTVGAISLVVPNRVPQANENFLGDRVQSAGKTGLNRTWNQRVDDLQKFRKHLQESAKEKQNLMEADKKVCLDSHQNLRCRKEHMERPQESNKKLEAGLRNLHHQLEVLTHKEEAQRKLEEQLEDTKSKLHEKNEILENAEVQFTAQLRALSQELETAEDALKESLNSAEVLLEDMLKAKEKLTPLFPDIQWNLKELNRFNKVPKNSLSQLIKISRSFINDLADHLLTLTKELTVNHKETEACKDENAKLLKMIERSESFSLKAQSEDQVETTERQKAETKAKEELLKEGVQKLTKEVFGKDVQAESLKLETQNLRECVEGLNQFILASGSGDAIRELASAQKQLSTLQLIYQQVSQERNCAFEKLEQYELEKAKFEGNTNKAIKDQSIELEKLHRQNLEMKEQLAAQQSTLAALQNERVRHLDEKTFLNTMFSELQEEFHKVEKLEGNLFTMKEEANRLTLIAEYNKQLGEVLRHEVIERDEVIGELQKNLKTLNDTQQENLQEKMVLYQELMAARSIKNALHSKLEEQIKKTAHLTEAQKTAELMTSKDLEAVKEMQSKERDAVKGMMTDFDALVCQQEELLKKQRKTTLKNESLRAKNKKLHAKIAKINQLIYQKISVIVQLELDVSEKEKEIQQLRLDFQGESAKHAKELGKLKSGNKRLSKERKVLQDNVEDLGKNVQKLQSDLNGACKNQKESEDLLQLKTKEAERLEALCDEKNSEFLRAQDERTQLASQVDDLTRQCRNLEDQRNTFTEHIKYLEGNADEQMEELKQELKAKMEMLGILEENFKSIERLCDHLKRDYKEIGVENRHLKDLKLELIAERESLIMSNDSLKEEVQNLSDKLELVHNYGKTGDLGEGIEVMVQTTDDNVSVDNNSCVKLEEAHRELVQKLQRMEELLEDEKLGREETERKLSDCVRKLDEVEAEKFAEVKKAETVYEELVRCKGKMDEMSEEGERVALMLDESKKVSLEIQAKYEEFEAQLTNYKEKYDYLKERYNALVSDEACHNNELLEAKERIEELKSELNNKHELVLKLQDIVARLQQDVASTEFERRQINIKLHDATKELELKQELSHSLELVNKRALAAISDMKEKGILQASECEMLFVMHSSDI